MADDGLYSIYSKLDEIYEILERNISSGKGNYSAPYNDAFVKEILDNIKNVMKKDRKTGEYVDTGKIDFKAITTAINNYLKLLDLSTSKSNTYVKAVMERVAKNYEKLAADSQAQQAYLARALKDLEKELVRLSSGEYSKTPMLNMKKAQNNPEAQEFLKGVRAELATLINMDSRVSKLAYLFETDVAGRKGRVRKFTEDLIEGLGRSKFVGGALSDMFRLLTYFAATYVKNIPLIGKPLAAILVALGSLGPSLVNGIISGITQALSIILFSRLGGKAGSAIFDKLFGGIGKLFSGGAAVKFFGGLFGGRASGKAASTVGTLVMDGKPLYTSTESLRKAGVITSSASKVGAGAGIAKILGAFGKITPWFGRIFGVVSKFLGPVGWILTGIQLAVLLFKNWDKVMGTIKNGWNTITSGSFWENVGEKLKNLGKDVAEKGKGFIETGKSFAQEHPVAGMFLGAFRPGTGMLTEAWKNLPVNIEKQKYDKLEIDQGGVPINLGKLSQSVAAQQLEAYRASNRELFDQYYDIVPEGYASLGSFTNDIVMRNSGTGKKGAVLYKGATEDLKNLRQVLKGAFIQRGLSEKAAEVKANQLSYTSGISSMTSVHSKTGGHSDPMGSGFDLGTGGRWSKEDWELAIPLVQDFYKGNLDAYYEANVNGKGRFTKPGVSLSNAHFHVEMAKSQRGSRPFSDIRSELWVENAKKKKLLDQTAKAEGQEDFNEVDAITKGSPIGIASPSSLSESSERKVKVEDNKFNQNGYTRIIQPDDSNIRSTIPAIKKSQTPRVDYTGDEMFSEVLRRTISAATRDPVQQ